MRPAARSKRAFSRATLAAADSISTHSMNTDELKRRLQGHFTDGLVTIVGSGHSAAFGLPNMPEIANVLDAEMPDRTPPGDDDWQRVADALDSGADLETALDLIPNGSPVIPQIVVLTAETVLKAELEAINAIMTGRARLALTELIPHLAVPVAPAS